MSITDELREFAPEIDGCKLMRPRDEKELLAIADRIDAEVKGMIELPKDADDVPWSVGDRDEDGNVVTELRLTYDGCWFVITDGEWPYRPKHKRHRHAPNVEDVLWEFLDEIENFHSPEEARDTIAEYAAKLRLAEGEDE